VFLHKAEEHPFILSSRNIAPSDAVGIILAQHHKRVKAQRLYISSFGAVISLIRVYKKECPRADLNHRHLGLQPSALPLSY
jgi:hypothetical protein